MCLLPYYIDPAPQGQAGCFPVYPKFCVGFLFSSPIGQRHWVYYAALARFMAGIDDLEDTARVDINGDGILSAADLTALARMLEAQQGTQTADADENGAPVDTGAELKRRCAGHRPDGGRRRAHGACACGGRCAGDR